MSLSQEFEIVPEEVIKVMEAKGYVVKRKNQWDKSKSNSTVNHPNHYKGVNGLEVFEVMDNFLPKYENAIDGYLVGNILKYVLRAPCKGKMNEDLRKAEKHLTMLINRTEGK